MTNKQQIIELIDRLPNDIFRGQAIEAIYFWEKVQAGLRQADEGELISHEEIVREFTANRT